MESMRCRALCAVLAFAPLAACADYEGSETSRTICREMRTDLPTYSTRDTAETLQSGARFVRTFNAICED